VTSSIPDQKKPSLEDVSLAHETIYTRSVSQQLNINGKRKSANEEKCQEIE